jgi:hypothetical protein
LRFKMKKKEKEQDRIGDIKATTKKEKESA